MRLPPQNFELLNYQISETRITTGHFRSPSQTTLPYIINFSRLALFSSEAGDSNFLENVGISIYHHKHGVTSKDRTPNS